MLDETFADETIALYKADVENMKALKGVEGTVAQAAIATVWLRCNWIIASSIWLACDMTLPLFAIL